MAVPVLFPSISLAMLDLPQPMLFPLAFPADSLTLDSDSDSELGPDSMPLPESDIVSIPDPNPNPNPNTDSEYASGSLPADVPMPSVQTESALAAPLAALESAAAIALLNNLLIFYQAERNWVHRTRASIELALVQGPIIDAPSAGQRAIPAPPIAGGSTVLRDSGTETELDTESETIVASETDSASDSSGSAPSVASNPPPSTDEPTPAGEPAFVKKEDSDTDLSTLDTAPTPAPAPAPGSSSSPPQSGRKQLAPFTLRAAVPAQAPSSRWLQRKQSFKLHLGPLAPHKPARPRTRRDGGGPEPSTQLLELFSDLVDARMESCLRITRLVRDANRSMLHTF